MKTLNLDDKRTVNDKLDMLHGHKRYVVVAMDDDGNFSYTVGTDADTMFLTYSAKILDIVTNEYVIDEILGGGDE